MKRSAVLTLLVAACGSPAAAPPASPTTGNTTTTAAAAPACTPTLVDVGVAVRVPEIMSKLLGPDGSVAGDAVRRCRKCSECDATGGNGDAVWCGLVCLGSGAVVNSCRF